MICSVFFILGNPRSGTSLLRSLLNAHPELVVPPECGFILWLRKDWAGSNWSDPGVLDAFCDAVLGSRKFETWSLGKLELMREFESRPVVNYANAVSRVVEAYARKRGKKINAWGDKNNHYALHGAELRDIFPDAKFIHIVRDVRDVACSYKDLAARSIDSRYRPELPADPTQIADEWVRNNSAVIQDVGDTSNYLSVRYEDVVLDTERTLDKAFDLLNVRSLGPIDRDLHLNGLDEPVEFLQWKEKLARPIEESSIGRFRTELDRESIGRLEANAGSLLRFFGYSIEQSPSVAG